MGTAAQETWCLSGIVEHRDKHSNVPRQVVKRSEIKHQLQTHCQVEKSMRGIMDPIASR